MKWVTVAGPAKAFHQENVPHATEPVSVRDSLGGRELRSERPRLSGSLRETGRQEEEKQEKVEGVKRTLEKKGVKGKRHAKRRSSAWWALLKGAHVT